MGVRIEIDKKRASESSDEEVMGKIVIMGIICKQQVNR
jgi:hypothetical protein